MSISNDFGDFLEATQAAATVDELKTLFGTAMTKEGFANHVFTTVGSQRLVSVMWHEFPTAYPDAYIGNNWQRIDPILPITLNARRAFRWEDALRTLRLNREQRQFFGACKEIGVFSGITFPMHGPNGRCDLISVSKRDNSDFDEARLPLLRAFSAQAWMRCVDLTGGETFLSLPDGPRLTPRERDVMLFIKDGKTSSQIAEILGLAVRTIEFHVENVLNKLGAPNRITAVVMCLQRGLI